MYFDAHAKINLYLDILGKRPDGFHELRMVTLPLELHDTMDVSLLKGDTDSYVTCDDLVLEVGRSNLINRALDKMREQFRFKDNFSIEVHKEIPIKAGLAGGSADAATTIKAVKTLLKLKMSEKEAASVALSVGSDVPFCLKGVPAKVSGIGDIIEPITVKKRYYVLIVMPGKGLSTSAVFREADKTELAHSSPDMLLKALAEGDDILLADSLFNSLQDVSARMLPEIGKIVDMLKEDGLNAVLMSGSGSAVYALLSDKRKAQSKARAYREKGYDTYVTRTLS